MVLVAVAKKWFLNGSNAVSGFDRNGRSNVGLGITKMGAENKREKLIYRLGYIGVLFFIFGGSLGEYCRQTSTSFPNYDTGHILSNGFSRNNWLYNSNRKYVIFYLLPGLSFLTAGVLYLINYYLKRKEPPKWPPDDLFRN